MNTPTTSRQQRLLQEMRATLILAWPIVIGQLASIGMNVVDTVLAGAHGAVSLGAVAVGTAAWSFILLIALGMQLAIAPSVSQLLGAEKHEEIGPLFRQALWWCALLSLLLFFLTHAVAYALPYFHIAADVLPHAQRFLLAIAYGAPALCLVFCCRYFVEGLAHTIPTLISGVAGLLLLIPLGYVLMNGSAYNSAYGTAGLGAATAIVLWVQAIGYLIYIASSKRFRPYAVFKHFEPAKFKAIFDLLRISAPMGMALLMEGGLFIAAALMMGALGAVPAAAHQIAINVASVCFMVPLGIGMATTVRVGIAKGANDASGVRWAALAGLAWVIGTQTITAIALGGFGEAIASIYTRDTAVIALAVSLLWLAAIFQYADGVQALFNGALRGLKDTFWPMWITVLAYWAIGFVAAYWLGIQAGQGAQGFWIGLIVGLSVAAIGLSWRFWIQARSGAGG